MTGTGTVAVYELQGNGDDIWDNQDEGFFVYTEKEGSWVLTGKVRWIDPGPNDWAKVGVMVREKGDLPQSTHYWIELRGAQYGDRTDAQWRTSEGASSGNLEIRYEGEAVMDWTGGGLWLRVTRVAEANLFFSEWSDDGKTWHFGHSQTQQMAPKVAYGIAITNHDDNDVLAVGEVTGVSLVPFSAVLGNRLIDPGAYMAGDTVAVSIALSNPGTTATTVVVEEVFPAGWTVSDISDGGSTAAGKITWNVSVPPGVPKVVTYKAKAPAAPDPTAVWSGKVGDLPIMGSTQAGLIIQLMVDFKVKCPYLTNTVTLDGKMSPGEYDGAYKEKIDFFTQGDIPPGVYISGNVWTPEQYNVTYYTFHDADYIYFAFEVVDPVVDFETGPNAWQNDSTELYLDGNLNRARPFDRSAQGFQLTVVGDGSWARENDNFDVTLVDLPEGGHTGSGLTFWNFGARGYAQPLQAGSYIVEYRVSKDGILIPRHRTLIGFDLLMNEADGSGARTGKYGWFNYPPETETVTECWNREDGWGLLELVGGPVRVPDWSVR